VTGERTDSSVFRKKRIFIPMIEVGGGHKAVGLAIRDAIERLHPGEYEMSVVDFPCICGARMTDRSLKAFWSACLAQPVITNKVNIWLEAMNGLLRSNAVTRFFSVDFVMKGMRYIRELQPDFIISTHFFCTSVAVFARETYGLDCRIVSHVNDPFHAHPFWVNQLADEVIVCSRSAFDHMAKMGQKQESMTILPLPLHAKFFDPVTRSREEILTELGLEPSRLTILASSGGEGIGDTSHFIREVYLSGLPVNLITVSGRNERLLKASRLLAARPSKALMAPIGYAANMNELAFASDVGLAKAGPSSLLEMLTKGCPVMLTHVAHQAEQGNLDFILDGGMGWDIRNPETFAEVLDNLLKPGFLEPYQRRIRENEYVRLLPGASERLAIHLLAGMKPP